MNLKLNKLLRNNEFIEKVTSSGHEYILRYCPIDLNKLGDNHPEYKVYVNPEKGTLKCFVCHPPGVGMSLNIPERRINRAFNLNNDKPKIERKPVKPIPVSTGMWEVDIDHPANLYLAGRGVSVSVSRENNLRYKEKGEPAWYSDKNLPCCKQPGIIIPVYTHGTLMGWQLAPVPRQEDRLKYITAPGSNLSASLYNIDRVIHRGEGTCVVTEGVFDCLKIPDYAISILSDNLGRRKLRLLSSGGFKRLVLMLDGDRTEEHILNEKSKLMGICSHVDVVRLEPDKDPGDYSRGELLELIDVR